MLSLILLLGLILRLISLRHSLWLDEAILAQAVSSLSLKSLLTKFMPTDFNPPLIYLLEWFWGRLFGFSEVSLRLPSVIFGLITIYLTFLLGKKFLKRLAWLPPLLLATSGLHVYYSQEARMYALAAMMVTGSMWALTEYLEKGAKKAAYVLFTIGALYSHYLTWLVLPAQAAIVYLVKPKKLVAWMQLGVVTLLSLIPLMPLFWQQLAAGSAAAGSTWGQLVGSLSLKQLGLIPVKFLIGRIGFTNRLLYFVVVAPILLVAAWLLRKALSQLKSAKNRDQLVIYGWLIIPLVSAVLLSFRLPILIYFRLLYLLPAVYLVLALGVKALPKTWRLKTIVFLVGFNLLTTFTYLYNPAFHREDWRHLSLMLSWLNPDSQPVMMAAPVQAPLKYYFAGNLTSFSDATPLKTTSDIWVVPYAAQIFDPQQTFAARLRAAGFQPVFAKNFAGDLTLIKYKRL